MNKKNKWAIPFAVLTAISGIAAGCSSGHKHSYTDWAYNETQHWKECPEDHDKDEGTIANHVFVDGSCVCGAVEQTPPVTDVTITNGTTDTNGTVTLSKTTAKVGDSITVTVTPNEGYQLKSLTVNGTNVFGAMTDNTYVFTVSENTTVIAVFEKIASSSIHAEIIGKKYGVTGSSLAAGTTVTLSADGRADITAAIEEDGKIRVEEIAGDNWKVKVDGYIAQEIMIPRDVEYTDAITLEYDLMENLSLSWGHNDQEDLSAQNEGKIVHSSGYYQWVSTKDAYHSVAITTTVVKGGYRQGVFIRFKGDTYDNDAFVMLEKEAQDKICICGAGDGYTGTNLWKDQWDNYLGSNDSNSLTNDEYELSLVREGRSIHIFVDGEFKATKEIPESYADKECYVGLFCTDATTMENSERTFAIQDISVFLGNKYSVTASLAAGCEEMGSISVDAADGKYYVDAQVKVTIAANAGYILESIQVDDGEAITEGWEQNGNVYTYTFPAPEGGATVVATLAESSEVTLSNVTVNITDGTNAINLGETVKATLTPSVGEAYDLTLTKEENGAYTFGGTFLKGEYRLSLVGKNLGYGSVTVKVDETVAPITMKYSLTSEIDKGPREDADITVTEDTISIVGTQHDAFAEWGSDHNDNQVPYATLNIPDEVKNAKNVMLEFNLKTSNQSGYFINGFGVGMTGFNGLRMLFADTGDKGYTPDGKIITAILNGRKTGEDNISGGNYSAETYGWIETLALTENGANIRAVRNGTTLRFYAQNEAGEWVLIKFLVPVNGDYGNLQYASSITVDENAQNDFRFIGNGADWTVSAINVTLNPTAIDSATYCKSNVTVTSETDLTGVDVTLVDKEDPSKTYTVQMKKTDAGQYYIEGYFRAGNYNITVDGFTCISAGYDENNEASTSLWIDSEGGLCWGIKLEATTATEDGE